MKLFECPMSVTLLCGLCFLSGLDTPAAYADFTFGEPVNLKSVIPVLDPAHDMPDCLSYDGLEMYIESNRPGGSGEDIWVLRRDSIDEDWGPPVNLGPTVNSSASDLGSAISSDGLTLYFQSIRPGGYGGMDAYMTTRGTKNAPWGPAVNLGPKINSSANEGSQSVDGLELYMSSNRPGGYGGSDIYVARRATVNDPWGDPVNLGPVVNSAYQESAFSLSPDGLVLLFSDWWEGTPRPGGYGAIDMWMTRRATLSDPWQTPVNLGPRVNSSITDFGARISPDGRMLYFITLRDGTWDNWQAPILPVVDFNGDGKVDIQDLLRLIESWGKDDPSVDIGPMPWGDGVVDAADLEVLMSYWLQEILDPALAAYWKLDETEGSVAHDSVTDNHGTVYGEPLWQPADGKKDGALAFDGIDDYVSTDFVLNPLDGAFSVFAWIQGSAPGDAVISQIDGVGGSGETWLGTEPSSGKFMSWLVPPAVGRFIPKPLVSESVITDGQWHHIGFVWDGSYRFLYVDGVEVAKDATAQAPLKPATGGLHIGAGKTLDAASFFSGLIDDVRIYNAALKAEQIQALAN